MKRHHQHHQTVVVEKNTVQERRGRRLKLGAVVAEVKYEEPPPRS